MNKVKKRKQISQIQIKWNEYTKNELDLPRSIFLTFLKGFNNVKKKILMSFHETPLHIHVTKKQFLLLILK